MSQILIGHDCTTAQRRGWGGIKNGELIRLAEAEFDLFITSDQNIRFQQNLSGCRIRVLELSTNDVRRIRAAAGIIVASVAEIQPGELRRLIIP